jgi:hypothetical protein
MSWPDEQTLRAILELPGVSGQTRHDIERYLDDPESWVRKARREMTPEQENARARYEARVEDDDAEDDTTLLEIEYELTIAQNDATALHRALQGAFQSHYTQLLEAGKI